MILPGQDGVDHINIYSRGKTALGRWMSNFYSQEMELDEGTFDSVEGYWYYLGTRDPRLKDLSGPRAKQLGKTLPVKVKLDEEIFRAKIQEALRVKVAGNPAMRETLANCKLPFCHYYEYSGKQIDAGYEWLAEYWGELQYAARRGVYISPPNEKASGVKAWLDLPLPPAPNYKCSNTSEVAGEIQPRRTAMFRVIVAGSRSFSDYNLLCEKLDALLIEKCRAGAEIEIVSGGARGADALGELYAKSRKLQVKRFPADWDKYGKCAGHLRNEQMAGYADALVAFWDGESPGTRSMIQLMEQRKKPVRVIRFVI